MEIEITTTKKKLTKNLISQIPIALFSELDNAEALGHINLALGTVILLKLENGDYRKVFWNNRTPAYRDLFLSKLEKLKEKSKQIYI